MVLCGASSMDLCSRFGRWWVLLTAYVGTAVAAAVAYLSWSGSWYALLVAVVQLVKHKQ